MRRIAVLMSYELAKQGMRTADSTLDIDETDLTKLTRFYLAKLQSYNILFNPKVLVRGNIMDDVLEETITELFRSATSS